MSRYEEMEDLLSGLIRRVQHTNAADLQAAPASTGTSLLPQHESYAAGVERLAMLLRDAEGLREILEEAGGGGALTETEHNDLLSLLGKVLHELWACETALRRAGPAD